MMKTTMKTSLCISGEESFATVHLLVVPDVGETLRMDNDFYTVKSRVFNLEAAYDGGKKYGYNQTCILILEKMNFYL